MQSHIESYRVIKNQTESYRVRQSQTESYRIYRVIHSYTELYRVKHNQLESYRVKQSQTESNRVKQSQTVSYRSYRQIGYPDIMVPGQNGTLTKIPGAMQVGASILHAGQTLPSSVLTPQPSAQALLVPPCISSDRQVPVTRILHSQVIFIFWLGCQQPAFTLTLSVFITQNVVLFTHL